MEEIINFNEAPQRQSPFTHIKNSLNYNGSKKQKRFSESVIIIQNIAMAEEMAQLVGMLALQSSGPKFELPPHT